MSANQQPDFFSDVESLSPKLLWLRKHGLTTAYDEMWDDDENKWSCYGIGKTYSNVTFLKEAGFGDTEESATIHYAALHGLTHYTLEDRQ